MQKFKTCFLALSSLLLFSQCQKQQNTVVENLSKLPANIELTSILNQDLQNTLSTSFQTYKSIISKIDQNISTTDIDFTQAYISSIKNADGKALSINLKVNNSTDVQYAFMLCKKGDKVGIPNLVKLVGRKSVEYYDLDNEQNTIILLTESGFKTTEIPFSNNNTAQKASGCGQATQDCVTDAYTNHGWVSVWATVQSAFIPATAVAIAAACAATNCL